MKTELKYLFLILVIFLGSVLSLGVLLNKYLYLTLDHLGNACRQVVTAFLWSPVHQTGVFLLIVSLLAGLIFFGKSLLTLLKTRTKVSRLVSNQTGMPTKLSQICRQAGLSESKVIVVENPAHYAFSYGLVWPKILISTGLIRRLSPQQLEAVVLHESYHLRLHHPFFLVAGEVMTATIFFLPILASLVKRMRIHFELGADSFAVARQGTSRHLSLAVATMLAPPDQDLIYPHFGLEALEERLGRLTGQPFQAKPLEKVKIGVSAGSLVVSLVLFLLPASAHLVRSSLSSPGSVRCGENQCLSGCPTHFPNDQNASA